MVRPTGSERNKRFAVLFANALTVQSVADPMEHTIGRAGNDSAYHVLTRCFPEVTRPENSRGVSPSEVNKALELAGYQRVRFRRTVLEQRFPNLPTSLGRSYRFGSRNWRNPELAEDLEHLRSMLPLLNRWVSAPCTLYTMVTTLRNAIALQSPLVAAHPESDDNGRKEDRDCNNDHLHQLLTASTRSSSASSGHDSSVDNGGAEVLSVHPEIGHGLSCADVQQYSDLGNTRLSTDDIDRLVMDPTFLELEGN